MIYWHRNYFELKAIKKQQIEKKPTSHRSAQRQNINSPCTTDSVLSSEMATEEPANKTYSLVPSHRYTFPQSVVFGSQELIFFFLSFILKFIGVFWRCYINWNAKPQLWVTFHFSFSLWSVQHAYKNVFHF